eukprot:749773-Hanusia_phi.AAC.12
MSLSSSVQTTAFKQQRSNNGVQTTAFKQRRSNNGALPLQDRNHVVSKVETFLQLCQTSTTSHPSISTWSA